MCIRIAVAALVGDPFLPVPSPSPSACLLPCLQRPPRGLPPTWARKPNAAHLAQAHLSKLQASGQPLLLPPQPFRL